MSIVPCRRIPHYITNRIAQKEVQPMVRQALAACNSTVAGFRRAVA